MRKLVTVLFIVIGFCFFSGPVLANDLNHKSLIDAGWKKILSKNGQNKLSRHSVKPDKDLNILSFIGTGIGDDGLYKVHCFLDNLPKRSKVIFFMDNEFLGKVSLGNTRFTRKKSDLASLKRTANINTNITLKKAGIHELFVKIVSPKGNDSITYQIDAKLFSAWIQDFKNNNNGTYTIRYQISPFFNFEIKDGAFIEVDIDGIGSFASNIVIDPNLDSWNDRAEYYTDVEITKAEREKLINNAANTTMTINDTNINIITYVW